MGPERASGPCYYMFTMGIESCNLLSSLAGLPPLNKHPDQRGRIPRVPNKAFFSFSCICAIN